MRVNLVQQRYKTLHEGFSYFPPNMRSLLFLLSPDSNFKNQLIVSDGSSINIQCIIKHTL